MPTYLLLGIFAGWLNRHQQATPYRVTLFSWREYARQKTRLKLAKKTSDLDGVVRQIQWLGLQHGQLLEEGRVRATVKALLQDPAAGE